MVAPKPFPYPVFVTRPVIPSLHKYVEQLRIIWERGWLTNHGDCERNLEELLSAYLDAANLSLVANGTLALMLACRALDLSGEVITTPFTFPATPHALLWAGLKPVFADIDPDTFTIDPECVDAAVTPLTSAILGVHVYGMPCDVVELEEVTERHGLRTLYDGAHAFGTTIEGRGIATFGDAVAFSFHATKLFHTAEGGAIAARDPATKTKINLLRNFGIRDQTTVLEPGINAKLTELQAALGILVLEEIDDEKKARAAVGTIYRQRLSGIAGIRCFTLPSTVGDSFQYFVIRVLAEECGIERDQFVNRMQAFNVVTRRYFFPLCSEYPHFRDLPSSRPENLPVANRVTKEVVCLPYFGDLGTENAHRICDMIESIVCP